MPTLKPTDEDRNLAEQATALADRSILVSASQIARWRDRSLLPTKRHGFGGPVGYTEQAARTATCIATVMEQDRTAHHRPRLSEAVVACFGRGCDVRLAGLRWAFRTELDRFLADMERIARSPDE